MTYLPILLKWAQSTSTEEPVEAKAKKTEEKVQGEKGLLGFGIILSAAIGLASLIFIPKLQARKVEKLEERLELENKFRATLAQILGGVVLLGGLYFTWKSLEVSREELKSSREASRQALEISQERQITERFTRAIDQLGATDQKGNKRLEIRLGGIYALERIAKDSKEDHWQVMEILTAYVRENAPWEGETKETLQSREDKKQESKDPLELTKSPTEISPPPADIQAILTVVGRRKWLEEEEKKDQRLNLARTDLKTADLRGANLQKANLRKANLQEAHLWKANLQEADLVEANLQKAHLAEANLQKAHLWKANLQWADLRWANLQEVWFSEANLHMATLFGANLQKVSTFAVDELCEAVTMNKAELDPELEKQVKERCPDRLGPYSSE